MNDRSKHRRFGWYVVNTTIFLAVILYATIVFAQSGGMTGVTRKNGAGCTCHNASPSTNVSVSINGPAELSVNQTGTYTVTIQGGPAVRAGTDIAASGGTLNATSSAIQKLGDELTHTSPLAFSGGVATFSFTYTAPGTPGTQTIFANGNSVNFNGDNSGDQWNFAPDKIITVKAATSASDDSPEIPSQFSLSQNYPNPFNPTTTIGFSLPSTQHVTLKVYDISGREIALLMSGELAGGRHLASFNAANLPSGTYIYRLSGAAGVQERTMLLLK